MPIRSILIISFHLRVHFSSSYFVSVLANKTQYAHHTPSRLIILDSIMLALITQHISNLLVSDLITDVQCITIIQLR
jgi:hypothetical protein